MQIIPVIDLKGGQVVHAVRGDRKHYQPIHLNSGLTASSAVDAVMAGFLNLYPFDTFYIADLDAITGNGADGHCRLIASLLDRYPHIHFWIDNGTQYSGLGSCRPPNYKTVIGTESQQAQPYPTSREANRDFILSLDFKQRQPSGHPAWFTDAGLWPEDIIVMTLNRVGGQAGPDFDKLSEFCTAYPAKNFIASGGIRDDSDLLRLVEMGIGAALLATALHGGALSGSEIGKLQAKKYPGKPGYF